MLASSVIRKLARSEEMFAETHNFVGLAAHLEGHVDIEALSTTFDSLLEAHPVLGGHIERGPDGRHQFVVNDLVHTGIEVVKLDDATAKPSYTSTRVSRWPSSGRPFATGRHS
jgi:phenolphthiocerol/phthiocerol/phthiodiolone dimycocerosyl transferase